MLGNSISSSSSNNNNHIMMRSVAPPKGVVAIVGVGPKLGRSVACKFALEGYTVAILSRHLEKLSRIADEIAREAKAQVFAIRIDCSESRSVKQAFEGVLSLGFVEVLVYNACLQDRDLHMTPPTPFLSVPLQSFQAALATSAVGAFHCSQQVIPGMLERGKGTIIFTGSSASRTGFAGHCTLSCGKFALRGLSQCLAREYQSSGIHVAHVIIDGAIGSPRLSRGETISNGNASTMDPDALAQTYWHIHVQDKSAWTQELDLRSPNQSFLE